MTYVKYPIRPLQAFIHKSITLPQLVHLKWCSHNKFLILLLSICSGSKISAACAWRVTRTRTNRRVAVGLFFCVLHGKSHTRCTRTTLPRVTQKSCTDNTWLTPHETERSPYVCSSSQHQNKIWWVWDPNEHGKAHLQFLKKEGCNCLLVNRSHV